jgi:hypothetical protein
MAAKAGLWAHVVISAPITRALTGEVARWSRQLAPLASALAARTQEIPAVCGGLQAATHWLWSARAAAITTHASELLLRSLAGHLSEGPNPLVDPARLTAATDGLARSLAAWLQVGGAWSELTTETRG